MRRIFIFFGPTLLAYLFKARCYAFQRIRYPFLDSLVLQLKPGQFHQPSSSCSQ